jgi:hypothetical protein
LLNRIASDLTAVPFHLDGNPTAITGDDQINTLVPNRMAIRLDLPPTGSIG